MPQPLSRQGGDEREVGVNKNVNCMASAEIRFTFIPSVAEQEYIFSVLSPPQSRDRDTLPRSR